VTRLDRYIFREVLTPTLIALIALTGILVGRQLSSLLELIIRWAPTARELWTLVSALVPGALTFTIPTAVLVGVLTGFGRMSSDSESVAFRAVGLKTITILRPVLVLGGLAWALNFVLAVWIAPAAISRLSSISLEIAAEQAALQIQPRLFNEDIPGRVLYFKDTSPDGREFSGILLANLATPEETEIIVAESGRLIGDGVDTGYEFTLFNGSQHTFSRLAPDRSTYSPFASTSLPIPLPAGATPTDDEPAVSDPLARPTRDLWTSVRNQSAGSAEQVELHRRLALPFAAMAFALIGFPLGLSTSRGGRSMGLVISAFLMLVYYMFFIGGTQIAANAQMSPFLGTWGANLFFAILGILLIIRSERDRGNRVLDWVIDVGGWLRLKLQPARKAPQKPGHWPYALTHHPSWLRTLDLYVLKAFWFYFGLILTVFISLFVVVTLFELLPDIMDNEVGIEVVGGYFFYLLPQIFYWVSPLAVLVAVLVSLGTLTKTNETLAVKAGAISLYRMAVPLLLMAGLLSAGTYALQDFLLPHTNRLQDSFRNTIKGRAQQSYQDPLRQWMAGSDDRIYYYSYFDPDANVFLDLAVFSFDPSTFSLDRWTFAPSAMWNGNNWVLENGWSRSVDANGQETYDPFQTLIFTEMDDAPNYFKKEVRLASQMNYPELRSYIEDLGNSGFDVSSLTVDLYRKLSFPLVSVIMAIIAVPFSFMTGRRGAFYGIGISIIIGISYWAAFELFDKLGGISQLSPMIAAWFPNLIFGFSGFWLLLRIRT